MIGYWFGSTLGYGDGRVPEVGITHEVEGIPVLCERGMHASERALDALCYSGCPTLWGVELGGEIVRGDDKACATQRTYLWRLDAEPALQAFARWCALSVAYLWEVPDVVRRYLETGDESLRAAAWASARAARASAMAAWDAAADGAAGASARASAWASAWASARASAWASAWASARASAWDAAADGAAWAARASAMAAGASAWDAAADGAAWDAQAVQLEELIAQARDGKTSWTWRLVEGRVEEVLP